jgi:MoaA/NifB/PqqE/SkfB family radical SAM enzyme
MIFGIRRHIVFYLSMVHILIIALFAYRNPLKAMTALNKLMQKRKRVAGGFRISKYVKSGKYYYWGLLAPGWPSPAFKNYILYELNRIYPYRSPDTFLQSIIFSVTNRCPLHCEHCFEWDKLDSREILSLMQLAHILTTFQKRGLIQAQLSGGEPLVRLDDTISLIESAQTGTDFWLLTSGYELTLDKAERLKKAGLIGVNISLDHWQEELHNRFRNNDKSFYWAEQAAKNSRAADLIVAFSLCATREFITEENLWRYAYLTRELGAGFVQILEPRKVGHYADKDVELNETHYRIIQEFYLKINSDKAFYSFPIFVYHGYHQRKMGCFGAGNRYLFVDANGDLHSCPFCQHAVGNALQNNLDQAIKKMKEIGCHRFETLTIE